LKFYSQAINLDSYGEQEMVDFVVKKNRKISN